MFCKFKSHVYWKEAINVLKNLSCYILKEMALLRVISIDET